MNINNYSTINKRQVKKYASEVCFCSLNKCKNLKIFFGCLTAGIYKIISSHIFPSLYRRTFSFASTNFISIFISASSSRFSALVKGFIALLSGIVHSTYFLFLDVTEFILDRHYIDLLMQ